MNLKIYQKHPKYVITHIIIGIIAAFYMPVLWAFLIYQTTQLVLNKRFFLFEWRIKDGNSIEHTVVKVIEFFAGFLIGKITQNSKILDRFRG